MMRLIAQILVGLMLLFGVLTLIPQAYMQFKYHRKSKGFLYIVLALLAVFFSYMAFYYAYLQISTL